MVARQPATKMTTQIGMQNVSGREGGVTAQIHFHLRGKPAQTKAIGPPGKIGRFGEIILRGNLLKHVIGEPILQNTDPGGIAAEGMSREGIDVIVRYAHAQRLKAGGSMLKAEFSKKDQGAGAWLGHWRGSPNGGPN